MYAGADGWLAVSLPRDGDLDLLPAWLETDDPAPDLVAEIRRRPVLELHERARLLGLAVSVVDGERPAPLTLPPDAPQAPIGRPLVVDFSALWSGPLCARLLGMAGARVIKVETPNRPDGARFGNPAFYDLLHAGHESLVIDPSEAPALVAAATWSSRPPARAPSPGGGCPAPAGTVWLSITAYGRAAGDRIGYGDDVAAGAGLVERDLDGAPLFVGDAIADPLTGLTGAVAVLRALGRTAERRERLIDLPMASVVAAARSD